MAALTGLKDKSEITKVAVAKSFKDMADATMQSLQTLAGAIKGGGFLDILSAVVGLGLQLGGAGVFGKSIAARLNLPGRATGGPVAAGTTYLVGERGPELFTAGRSGMIHPTESLRAMGGGGPLGLKVEVIANNNGFGAIVRNYAGQVVAEAAPGTAAMGAQMAGMQAARNQSRRWG